ncbi:MAG: cytochrome C biogenesis protein [Betaproteobacteria bacterium CG2_30_59_46]|nr:MAG: cytochrome C biogenesis protein [Betaproteobacteria bacterium CG2_30_59_46]PIQ13519.1 MAG: cytochrome C biogenesis protein [Hydrogenophilales bacterium CG18_big_fil_WC_8_21_14_2_50_58_12]PIY01644.1 MAG: cytochrome C biogenesis protein [Hydrogenophilales bacterium CG_4_10_14_3_um_filter_58_23]PJB08104.1 MAG: cytochrome C biogenesis protein [Hydrogenophilales bacterium CG_4_9_14_3_um_filter_59_35]
MSESLHFLTFLIYSALGLLFWRSVWRPAESETSQHTTEASAVWRLAILVPLALHGALLQPSLFPGVGLSLGAGNTLSAISWLTVLVYWLASFRYNMEGLQTLVLPGAALCLLAPLVFPEAHTIPHTELPLFKIHLLLSLLAYSLFTIAAVHAVLMALAERRLHGHALARILGKLPPLLAMETLLFRIITVGFVLLTLSILSGVMFSEELFHKPLQFNHKSLFALLSWGIYAALLGGRKIYGWRGRTAILWTLAGFAMLLLAYLGSKFVLEVILQR